MNFMNKRLIGNENNSIFYEDDNGNYKTVEHGIINLLTSI